MMGSSWTRVAAHAEAAPWLAPTPEAARVMPALVRPTEIHHLHSVDSVQRFHDQAIPLRDRPLTMLALTAEALKAEYPGVVFGSDLKNAWKENGKALSEDTRFILYFAHPTPTGKIKLDVAHLDPQASRPVAIAKEADVLQAKAPKGYNASKDNAARVDKRFFKRPGWRYPVDATMQRFGQYFSGAHEGLSLPKNMGLILASLGVTSVTLSAFLYGVLEMADYETVDAKLAQLKKKQLQDQQNQLLTQPLMPA